MQPTALPPKELVYLSPDPRSGPIRIEDGMNLRVEMGDLEELMTSIVQNGLEQMLHVRKEDGMYILEDGHRRLTAIRMAIEKGHKFAAIPCRVVTEHQSESQRVLAQLTRNSGKPFTPYEQALGVQRLLKLNWKDSDIAAKLGFSVPFLSDLKLLLSAPAAAKKLVAAGRVTASLVVDLMKSTDQPQTLVPILAAADKKAQESGSRIMPKHLAEPLKVVQDRKKRKNGNSAETTLPPVAEQYDFSLVVPRARALYESVAADKNAKKPSVAARIDALRMLIPYLEGAEDLQSIKKKFFNTEGVELPGKLKSA